MTHKLTLDILTLSDPIPGVDYLINSNNGRGSLYRRLNATVVANSVLGTYNIIVKGYVRFSNTHTHYI